MTGRTGQQIRIHDVLICLRRVRHTRPDQWSACCPAHHDRNPSLSIGLGDGGKLLFTCHAGCSFQDIMQALNLPIQEGGTRVDRGHHRHSLSNATAVYDYCDTVGNVLYKVARYADPKDFRPWQPDSCGGWEMKLSASTPRVPYQLQQLRANREAVVLWLEGEKDVDRAIEAGFVATTTQGGAQGLRSSAEAMRKYLAGRHVAIISDADDAGDAYAAAALRAIQDTAASVVIVRLPGLEHRPSHGEDLSDWLDTHGHTADELRSLIEGNVRASGSTVREDANGEKSEKTAEGDRGEEVQGTPITQARRKPPNAMRPEAYYGLAGDIVRAIDPHTEAAPAGVLVQVLTIFGAIAGRKTYFRASADRHYPNLYVALVGDTASGRKGMSWGAARHVFTLVPELEEWLREHTIGGMSSGEGLIHPVRDCKDKEDEDGSRKTQPEPLQMDKRVIVRESEFSSVLKMPARDGNNLSEVQRRAWDGDVLQTLTKNSPERATGAHIAIIGNITREELARHLSQTDTANGFANRYLWVHVTRSKLLPDGGELDEANLQPLAHRLEAAIKFVEGLESYHVMTRDTEARALWHKEYGRLTVGNPGLFGAMTARGAPQVMRLSMIYALLDCSQVVRVQHLQAALAVWEYVEESVRYIFGDALGDPIADAILRKLRAAPEGMTRTEISALFARHVKAAELDRALSLLQERQFAGYETEESEQGRRTERWYCSMVGTAVVRHTEEATSAPTPDGDISHNSQFAPSHVAHGPTDTDEWGEVA